jgi:hypothetical protein
VALIALAAVLGAAAARGDTEAVNVFGDYQL